LILDYKEFISLVEQFAEELPPLLASHHKTRDFAPRVHRLLQFAETRFTLAVVGQMRAGKSSLLNALIGADLAMVGVNETTATINWFTYGTGKQTQGFRVHWKGRPPEDRDLCEKEQWIGESTLAKDTRKLEFFADTDFLKTADVVDTPGTRSLIAEHQEKVDEFLAQKADNETRQLGNGADAILYVIPPVARDSDSDLLEQFKRTTRLPDSPPHNSLAVVHKWESLESDDPYAEAHRKAGHIYEAMQDCISHVMPASAPLGRAAEQFPDIFWHMTLNLSANTPIAEMVELLLGEEDFLENDSPGCPLDSAARSKLRLEFKLPWPCLKLILRTARRRSPGGPSDLRKIILEMSGLPKLRQEIQDRFFARAGALKMSKLLATAFEPCHRAEHLLRNFKLELNHDLQKAERVQKMLAERIDGGDSALLPVQEFIQSAVRKSKDDALHVAENLRCISIAALDAKEKQQRLEQDMEMINTLDGAHKLPPELVDILRCLSGRSGGDIPARLSFLRRLNRTNAQLADLDSTITKLQEFSRRVPEDVKDAVGQGVSRLEEIADWMEDKHLTEIPLSPQSL
jgi:hypothetical protein